MFKNLTIKTRLIAGFGIVIVLCIIISAISITALTSINEDLELIVEDRYPKTVKANDISDNVNIIARALRNMILLSSRDEIDREMKRLEDARKIVGDRVADLTKTVRSEKGKQMISRLTAVRLSYIEVTQANMTLIKDGKKEQAVEHLMQKVRPVQNDYFKAIEEIIAYQGSLMVESGKKTESTVAKLRLVIVCLAVGSIVLSVLIVLFIVRSITIPLAEGISVANRLASGDLTATVSTNSADEVGQLMAAMDVMVKSLRELIGRIKYAADNLASGSEQLSASAEEISRGMDGQAQRSNQIATATEEMSQTVIDVAKNTSNIAEISTQTFGQAKDGEAVVNRSVGEVQAIASTVAESSSVMQRLGSSSQEIGNIVDVINDIADQTNLLALNAAIEAARAGEQGRGFAVVADEVRKLAERTSQATSQIGTMIRAIQVEVGNAVVSMDTATNRVETGVDFSRKAGESLGSIVQSVSSLQSMVQQIASATEEMSSVSETISSDIQSIAEGSKEISAGGEQIAQASSDLAKLATELQSVVSQFKV